MTDSPTGWAEFLADGETLLWQGRPDSRIEWSSLLSVESAFGLFFTGFSVFWIVGARMITAMIGQSGGMEVVFALFPLFGIPFLLVGLYMVAGRLFWDAYLRARTWYALSDRAAYIARETRGKRSLKRYPIDTMQAPELIDGSAGSVFFAEELHQHSYSNRSSGSTTSPLPGGGFGRTPGMGRRRLHTSTQRVPIGFRRIPDARRVYRQIVELRDRVKPTRDA